VMVGDLVACSASIKAEVPLLVNKISRSGYTSDSRSVASAMADDSGCGEEAKCTRAARHRALARMAA